MTPAQSLPEPIATAHRRMEIGFQRLTDNEATRLLECATAEFWRAERLDFVLRLEVVRSNRLEDWLETERADNRSLLADKARLKRVNRRLWWELIAAVIVGLTLCLWSHHVAS